MLKQFIIINSELKMNIGTIAKCAALGEAAFMECLYSNVESVQRGNRLCDSSIHMPMVSRWYRWSTSENRITIALKGKTAEIVDMVNVLADREIWYENIYDDKYNIMCLSVEVLEKEVSDELFGNWKLL